MLDKCLQCGEPVYEPGDVICDTCVFEEHKDEIDTPRHSEERTEKDT